MEKETKLPTISFSTFILSLHSSALLYLGIIEDPVTKQKTSNIAIAKQSIDAIAMLDEKTKGNLTSDEDKLIKNILHDLRMQYIDSKKNKA